LFSYVSLRFPRQRKWLHLLCNTTYNPKMIALIVFVPKKLPWLAKNIGKVTEEPKKTTEEIESINI
jgi:hypothetical protein